MTWKFKKVRNYDKMRVLHEIEADLMPEAFEKKLFDVEIPVS
ncbi:MAG: hypothetical protein ACE5DM_03695 [Candidatus Nanoarchaeia archaeon]